MCYYLRQETSTYAQPWKICADFAMRLGVTNPAGGAGTFFKPDPGESIWDALRRQTSWFEPDGKNAFYKTQLRPGEYYPRIARPVNFRINSRPGESPGAHLNTNAIAIARSQLIVLARQLDRICQTVHPTIQTLNTFGHDIRNLLILACTEVEAHWRAVLNANGVKNGRLSTKEYVRLLGAMRLDEYAVTFPNYPWLEALQPYKGWGRTKNPTKDLRWYDSYNAVKHDRESEFEKGTLGHVFEAICASFIMMAAQFGDDEVYPRSEIQSYFKFSAFPNWSPSEAYIEPCDEPHRDWSPVQFNFGIS
jgi:hypothetical protein